MSLNRFAQYLNDGEIYFGGEIDKETLYMEPTILTNVKLDSSIMTEEIFGPILPIIEFDDLNQIINIIVSPYCKILFHYQPILIFSKFVLNKI
jgi:aldehyde dehydrogenase (NAD+)